MLIQTHPLIKSLNDFLLGNITHNDQNMTDDLELPQLVVAFNSAIRPGELHNQTLGTRCQIHNNLMCTIWLAVVCVTSFINSCQNPPRPKLPRTQLNLNQKLLVCTYIYIYIY